MGIVTKKYLQEHSLDHLCLNEVYLGASISNVGFQDKNADEPDRKCIVARVQSSAKLSEDTKSQIEKELLKNNPYKYGGEEYPIFIRYHGIQHINNTYEKTSNLRVNRNNTPDYHLKCFQCSSR